MGGIGKRQRPSSVLTLFEKEVTARVMKETLGGKFSGKSGPDDNVGLKEENTDEIHDPVTEKRSATRNMKKDTAPENKSATKIEVDYFPRFEVVLTKHRLYKLSLSKEFTVKAGLICDKSVVLEYPPKNKYWSVTLHKPKDALYRLDLSAGWTAFRKANLVYGKTYSFVFNPAKNVIQVSNNK